MTSRISIITPTYNQAKFLERCINSVISQDIKNLDYIIIDGASTDDTVDIIKKYEESLNYWISEPDKGQSDAINKGMTKAAGKIINWLNSDDYYEPEALAFINEVFDNKATNVVCGISKLFDENGIRGYSRGTDIYEGNLAKTIAWARIDQPETFFLKEAWDIVGHLNENLHYTMDREWWMRYLYHFGLEGVQKYEKVLVNFRLHPHSKSVSESQEFQIEHDTLFYKLALAAKNNRIAEIIEKYCSVNPSFTSKIEGWNNYQLINEILNYYLLKRADEFHYFGQRQISSKFLIIINSSLLKLNDKLLYYKLKILNLIPGSIIKHLRKLKQVVHG